MSSLIGKFLGLSSGAINRASNPYATETTSVAKPAYKTATYASIPYERPPKVTDTVPTKGLLPGYVTPENVWVA